MSNRKVDVPVRGHHLRRMLRRGQIDWLQFRAGVKLREIFKAVELTGFGVGIGEVTPAHVEASKSLVEIKARLGEDRMLLLYDTIVRGMSIKDATLCRKNIGKYAYNWFGKEFRASLDIVALTLGM